MSASTRVACRECLPAKPPATWEISEMKRIAIAAVVLFMPLGPAWADAYSKCLGFMSSRVSLADPVFPAAACELAADDFWADVQIQVAIMYLRGTYGAPQDHATAAAWFRRAAEQGDARAQFDLGVMYNIGKGVPHDDAAAAWSRKAAEQGHGFAQHSVGLMYFNGRGVPRDYVQAHMWLNLALARGVDHSRRDRDIVAEQMTPADISKARALAREWLATHGQ